MIYGPRRVGKTTLLQNFLAQTPLKYKLDSGDNIRTQQILSSQDFSQIQAYVEGYELLAIDEAQNIPNRNARIEIVSEIANSYLLKDIPSFDRVKSSRTLLDLLKLLAFQVGSVVSLNELATQLGVEVRTVQRYLDLLEKSFVIIRMSGFSRNLRQEITSKAKYYFLDTGIRNALIAQFNSPDQRNDLGQLWENFFIVERLKYRTYASIPANMYFWRTYDQQEINLVEERSGRLYGYECKWALKKPIAPPRSWVETYTDAEFSVVHPNNYLDFVLAGEV